ncbi:MAG TPA: transposase, partial [Terriglobales bacterium]|nr:transposase [Terriglobales bacterium]
MLDNNFAFFVGVDWGSTSHQICVLDAAGQPAAEFSATHGGDGLRGLCQRLLALAPAASAIAVAIESPSSPATEPLLQAG